MTKEEVHHNNIIVISDPQKAVEDKIKVDMARRKAALPSKITGAILLLFILAGGVLYIVHKRGAMDYSWCLLVWCLTAFPAILWFSTWASQEYIPYSPNTVYWMATAKSNVQKMHISPASGGRIPWPATLHIVIKRENGKTKEENISLGYSPHYCDDIKQDIVDLTLNNEDGVWFAPADRKRKKTEQSITSMRKVVEYYGKDNGNENFNEEDEY